MLNQFKFFEGQSSILYQYSDRTINPNNYGHITISRPDPPFGISRRHWNILPQDLRGTTLQEIDCYIRGWEDAGRNIVDSPYHDRTRTILWNRGFTTYQVRVANPSRTREVAVIAASPHDFRIWRSENFSWDSINVLTNSHFSYTDDNNITTRYRSITTINECNGLMFDDYITTRRLNDILNSGYEDTINHIHEIINEVRLCVRTNN